MVGCIRLYLEPRPDLPDHMRPSDFIPVIDCNPEQARDLRRRFQRQGYIVHAFPI